MITLSSDFGTPYPAAMKGVILDRLRDADSADTVDADADADVRLVDVAHDFPRQDVRTAAFWLREVLPWFPPAVHLVVVDPGVGTDRAAIAIRADDHALVGPDNGVLVPAARRLTSGGNPPRDDALHVFEVEVSDPASATFHGRDVFAPAAADVHGAGVDAIEGIDGFEPAADFVDLRFPDPDVGADGATGEVFVVDGFGNAITNVPGGVLDGRYGDSIRVNGGAAPVRRSYARVDPGERLVTVGSHGNVELAANRGRGDEAFGVSTGDSVALAW